ncbi:hypothetical protein V8G54_012915 [Vigna mungo]|uniref:Uncharacterized protein n=1 Tax=Vigna mungo TaxID=3915 RepID=A0AAQ3S4G3_VIGMU
MIHEERKEQKRISAAYRKSAEVHTLRALDYNQQGNYPLADQELEETKLSLEILIKLSPLGKPKKSRSSMDLPSSSVVAERKIKKEEERKEAEVHILRAMEYQEEGKYALAVQEVKESKLSLEILIPPVEPGKQKKRISRFRWI